MCENTKRRNVELDVTYKLVSVYDPEYFELKQKYEELCKAVLKYDDCDSASQSKRACPHMIKLAKGETN